MAAIPSSLEASKDSHLRNMLLPRQQTISDYNMQGNRASSQDDNVIAFPVIRFIRRKRITTPVPPRPPNSQFIPRCSQTHPFHMPCPKLNQCTLTPPETPCPSFIHACIPRVGAEFSWGSSRINQSVLVRRAKRPQIWTDGSIDESRMSNGRLTAPQEEQVLLLWPLAPHFGQSVPCMLMESREGSKRGYVDLVQ